MRHRPTARRRWQQQQQLQQRSAEPLAMAVARRGAMVAQLWAVLLLVLAQCKQTQTPLQQQQQQQQTCSSADAPPELFGYEVVAEFPHDANAFTQGLEYDVVCKPGSPNDCREVLWESTGMYGQSTMRMTHLDSGVVEKQVPLAGSSFGEGATRAGDRIYQVTWETNLGYAYSAPDLKPLGTFRTPLKDGWGAAADKGGLVVLSDGSDRLTWADPANNWRAVRSVQVRDGRRAVRYLNELELINGEVWANVWQTECVARICPDTGKVKGWLLLHGLRGSLAARNLAAQPMDVLNGIAYDRANRRLFITGKYWPRIFEVVPQPLPPGDAKAQQMRTSCLAHSSPVEH